MKKLVHHAFAGHTLALSCGEIKVNAKGEVETKSAEVEERLMALGFETVGAVKTPAKVEDADAEADAKVEEALEDAQDVIEQAQDALEDAAEALEDAKPKKRFKKVK